MSHCVNDRRNRFRVLSSLNLPPEIDLMAPRRTERDRSSLDAAGGVL
jgi:hypothetical protein